jgi:cephalosporin-C deacetylase
MQKQQWMVIGLMVWYGCVAAQQLAVPTGAVERVAVATVNVAPDRGDWTYELGQPVRFEISVLVDGNLVPDAVVRYTLGPEKFEAAAVELTLPSGRAVIDGGTMDVPGFLRCTVTTRFGGQTFNGMATVGYAPQDIQPTQSDPADFDEFWRQELAAMASVPLDLRRRLLPELCTADVNVYEVSYAVPVGGVVSRFYGTLSEPVAAGTYPALLRVPGAGVRAYGSEAALAARGVIVLQVGIHGIPVQMPVSVYEDLRSGALRDYPTFNANQRDHYYYRRVYLGCVRGIDALVAHPQWDGRTVVVAGGSQGGQLSLVVSALDPRVSGTVSNYPAYCDLTGYVHGRAGGWPHILSRPAFTTPDVIAATAYYDVVNFARRLRAPVSLAWGYNDVVCPPTSMHAAYNVITAPKELYLQLNMGHGPGPEFNKRYNERVHAMLGLE